MEKEYEDELDKSGALGAFSFEPEFSSSPLSSEMLAKSRQLSPRREQINERRDALMNAYKMLIDAQQYRTSAPRAPQWAKGSAMLMKSGNPTAEMIGAGGAAELQALMAQDKERLGAEQLQALTGMKMNAQNLDFLDEDQKTSLGLLSKAADSDYRSNSLQLRAMLAAIQAGGGANGANATQQPNEESFRTLGVPQYKGNDPYQGLDKVGSRQLRMNFEKQLKEAEDEASKASQDIDKIKRFMQLNESSKNNLIGTGPIADYVPTFSDDLQEMASISASVVPNMRTAGSGSTSDFDAKMFQRATFGTDKDYEPNKNIATAYLMQKQNQVEKSAFLENYLSANGHLRGSQQAWQKYLNDNPIFDPKDAKNPKLNSSRKSWQEYYGLSKEESSEGEEQRPSFPKAPKGYDAARWEKIYSKMTPEQKKLFGG